MSRSIVYSQEDEKGDIAWKIEKPLATVPRLSDLLAAEATSTSPEQRAAIVFSPQGLQILDRLTTHYIQPLEKAAEDVERELRNVKQKRMLIKERRENAARFLKLWTTAASRTAPFDSVTEEFIP